MQFFAVNKKKYSLVYVIENMFNNEVNFDIKDKIKFGLSHEFPSIDKEKEYSFRVYVMTCEDVVKTVSFYFI